MSSATGTFMAINGLSMDAMIQGFQRDDKDIQSFDRTEGNTFEGTLYAVKREWSFEVPWDPNGDKITSIREWLKGRGHYWNFERVDGGTTRFNKFSTEGGPGFSSATIVTGSTPTKFGAWALTTASGFTSVVTVSFGNDNRWSVSMWKLDNTTNQFINTAAVFDGATTRFYAGQAALTTSFAWCSISAVSGFLSLTINGTNTSGNATTSWVDGLMIVPYAMSTPQIVARFNRTVAEPGFPYVEAAGDFIEDLNPITVKCFVESEGLTQVGNGSLARELKVHVVEK